jgi:hypothetical protein
VIGTYIDSCVSTSPHLRPHTEVPTNGSLDGEAEPPEPYGPLIFPVVDCTPEEPCSLCQGDCDVDDDCEGDLVCYHHYGRVNKGLDGDGVVLGCEGYDYSKTDWCIQLPPEFDDGGRTYTRLNTRSKPSGDGYQFKMMQIADIHLGENA